MNVPDIGIEIPEISQVALVVEDLREAIEQYRFVLGVEPWDVYYIGPPEQQDAYYYGEHTDAAFGIGYADVGGLELEIIEPLGGESIHRDFLEERGEGIHHVACFAFDDPYEVAAAFDDADVPIVQSGWWHDTHYMYFDTRNIMNGVYFETLAGGEYDPGPEYRYPPQADEDSGT
jgi:catechol 2,3-dioxygenase-like lactoylglutathione lyase family enzyme